MPHTELLWALQSLKMRLWPAYGFLKTSRKAQTSQRNRDSGLSSPVTYLPQGSSNFTKEILKSSSVSCTTLFSSSSFFLSHRGEKYSAFKGSIYLIIQHEQNVSKRLRQKVSQKLIKGKKKKGGVEKKRGWCALEGLQTVSPSTQGILHALKSTVRYTCYGCHPDACTRGHSHILFHAKAGTPHSNTHAHTSQCDENCQ